MPSSFPSTPFTPLADAMEESIATGVYDPREGLIEFRGQLAQEYLPSSLNPSSLEERLWGHVFMLDSYEDMEVEYAFVASLLTKTLKEHGVLPQGEAPTS